MDDCCPGSIVFYKRQILMFQKQLLSAMGKKTRVEINKCPACLLIKGNISEMQRCYNQLKK